MQFERAYELLDSSPANLSEKTESLRANSGSRLQSCVSLNVPRVPPGIAAVTRSAEPKIMRLLLVSLDLSLYLWAERISAQLDAVNNLWSVAALRPPLLVTTVTLAVSSQGTQCREGDLAHVLEADHVEK